MRRSSSETVGCTDVPVFRRPIRRNPELIWQIYHFGIQVRFRKFVGRSESGCDPRAGSQSGPTPDLDGRCGSTCGRRESDPPARPGPLAVRRGRSRTNEILHMSLFPTATKQTTRWFPADSHRRYNSMVSSFSSMTPAISTRFRPKTATDFECSHMEIGIRSNVSFKGENAKRICSQIFLACRARDS